MLHHIVQGTRLPREIHDRRPVDHAFIRRAQGRVEKLLAQYQAPEIDPGVREALAAYVAEKKAKAPAAFA